MSVHTAGRKLGKVGTLTSVATGPVAIVSPVVLGPYPITPWIALLQFLGDFT